MQVNVKSYFKVIVLLTGAFISISLNAQLNDPTRDSLQDQLFAIESKYRYTNLDSALILFQEVAGEARQKKLAALELNAILLMAWSCLDHREIDLFQYYHKKGVSFLQHQQKKITSSEATDLLARFTYASAMFHYMLGQFEEALTEFKKIISSQLQADSLVIFSTQTSIGKCYFNLGNFDMAIEAYEMAFVCIPQSSDNYTDIRDYDYYYSVNRSQIGESYLNKEIVYAEPISTTKAFTYYHAALQQINTKPRDPAIDNLLVTNFNRLAKAHQLATNYDSALFYLNQSLSINPKNDIELTKTYLLLGDIYLERKEFNKSRTYYQLRLEGIEKKFPGKHYSKGEVLYHMGYTYLVQGDLKNALQYYQHALRQLVPEFKTTEGIYPNPSIETIGLNSTNEVIHVLSLKAQALKQKFNVAHNPKDLIEALKIYHLIMNLVDKMRKQFPSDGFKKFLSSKSLTLYEGALETVFDLYQLNSDSTFLDHAFEFAEKSKSLLLLENFKNSNAKVFAGIPGKVLKREDELIDHITYLHEELRKTSDDKDIHSLKNKIQHLQQEYVALIEQFESLYPAYYKLKYDLSTLSIQEVRDHLLENNEAFIEYVLGSNHVYIIAIAKTGSVFFQIPSDANLLEKITSFRKSILKNDPHHFGSHSHRLYLSFFSKLEPFLDDHSIHKITLVADGYLHYIPFEVLLKKKINTGDNFTNMKYLISEFQIHYQYSATLAYESNLLKKNPAPNMVLGFAPEFSTLSVKNQRILDLAPGSSLSTLDGARKELEILKKKFPGDYYMKDEATEKRFKDISNQYQVIHLATHAIIDDINPQLSKLIFSKDKIFTNDGDLFGYELYNLKINAELVTLSACNTGIGKLQRGEGLMNLARGFMFAGCPNVVMSLWAAPDEATAALMELFYEEIRKGKPKDEALRNAKLLYLSKADPLTASPYYWGSFIMVGNPTPIAITSHNWKIWWVITLMLILSTVVIFLFWKRNAHKLRF